VNRNEMLRAADEFLRWDHVGGVESAGVERRRKAERALFMQPVLA
jgi:GH24 family phage-related lysozyme (muramidase)